MIVYIFHLSFSAHYVRGVGGEGGEGMRVDMVELPWLVMSGGVRFDKVGGGTAG